MPKQIKVTEHLLQMAVAELGLSSKIINRLEDHNVLTVQQLLYCCGRTYHCSKCDRLGDCQVIVKLVEIDQVSKTSINQIYEALWLASREGGSSDVAR